MKLMYQLLVAQFETTVEAHAMHWIKNLRVNAPMVRDSIATFQSRAETVLILGPGASIQRYADSLRRVQERRDIFLLASPTVMPWLMENGISPDVVIAVDRQDEQWQWVKQSRWRGPVWMPTFGNPKLAEEYATYWFNLTIGKPGYQPLVDACTLTQYDELPSLPSLAHVGGHAFQLSQYLANIGACAFKRCVMIGCDYGYYKGEARVRLTGDHVTETVPEDAITIEGVQTNYKMALYKERLYTTWRVNPMPLYSISHGLLHELPRCTMSNVFAGEFPPDLPPQEKARAHERYLLETLPPILVPELYIPWWKRRKKKPAG